MFPPGEYNLRLGVMKELHPDLIATHQGDVRVFEGHAFMVEAAVSVGGRDIRQGEARRWHTCLHCMGLRRNAPLSWRQALSVSGRDVQHGEPRL